MNAYLAAYLAHARAVTAWHAEPVRHVRMVRADAVTAAVRRLHRARRQLGA